MKTTHTPGNWIAEHRHIHTAHPNGKPNWMLAIADFEDVDGGQGRANCRLCASAPELLAACKEAMVIISQHYPAQVNCCNDRIQTIRSAIAKAEQGEARAEADYLNRA